MLKFGEDKIKNIKYGNLDIVKICYGDDMIYQKHKNIITGTTLNDNPFNIYLSGKYYKITPVNKQFTFGTYKTITRMSSLFQGCSNITSLNLSGLDVSKVTDMSFAFQNCYNLNLIEGLETWNTSSLTNIHSLFRGCSGLTSINLSGWDVSKVTNNSYLFSRCSRLTSINLSGWNTFKTTSIFTLFEESNSLNHITCNFNFYELCFKYYNYQFLPLTMQEDGSGVWEIIDIENYVLTPISLEIANYEDLTYYDLTLPNIVSAKATNVETELIYKYNKLSKSTNKLEERTRHFKYKSNNFEENTDTENSRTITVSFTYNELTITANIVQNRLLSNVIKGTTINDEPLFTNLNNDYVKIIPVNNKFEYQIEEILNNFQNGFENCQTIKSLDLSEVDTYFANLENICNNCSELTSLNLSGCNLYSLSNNLFGDNLLKLEYLDISNLYLHGEYNLSFETLINIKHINLSNCNNVITPWNSLKISFHNCQNLTTIEGLETLNVSGIDFFEYLFKRCSSLTSIDLSSWNVTIVAMYETFAGCSSLTSLDISGIDITEDFEADNLFGETFGYDENYEEITLSGCKNLTYIKCKQAFKDYCLTNIDLVQLPETMQEDGTGTWEIVD